MFHLVLNAIFTMFLLSVAGSNYPGGQAIARLHRLEKDSIEPVHVHIDVLTAQTGVSRFTQTNGSWLYSKQENLTIDDPDILQFTHLLMEGRSKHSSNVKLYLKTHDIIDSIQGFSHISLNYNVLPPIKIKTKPTIFILKRKSNIKYDSNKARLWTPVKDFVNQIHNTENGKLNTSFKEEIVNELVKSEEEFEKAKETIEQNYSNIELEENKKENDTIKKKVEILEDLSQEDKSIENAATWETENINKLSLNSRNENEENINSQENFEYVSDIDDIKSEEVKVEKEDIKGKSKNDINVGPESHGVKETVKKMIQEKLLKAKQRREVNDERKNTELPIKPMKKRGVAADLLKRIEVLKQELKESPTIFIDKSATMQKESKITKGHIKDDKLTKQKLVTQKKDKIKIVKSSDLEQSEDTIEEENEIVDVKVDAKKIVKLLDNKVDSELLSTEAEIAEEEDKEEIAKMSKSVNVRESIRNIINQFKEFEEDFIRDDTDITSDMNNADRIESVENDGQVMIKDARESLKEILDQFKYIKHELTSEEDDQFDEIAAKYMERPIAETLLQFNEALKALIQRRKITSSKVHAANLHEKDTHLSENQEKFVAEESDENSNNVNTSNEENSQKNTKSRNEL